MKVHLIAGIGARLTLAGACRVVSKFPSEGQFGSVQRAIDSLSTTSAEPQCIFISRGEYVESVHVAERKAQLSIYGETMTGDRQALGPFADNLVTLKANVPITGGGSGNGGPALHIAAQNFRLYHVSLVALPDASRAAATALRAGADSGYYGCQIKGGDRALVASSGRQLYAECLVEGDNDIVAGDQTRAWFQKSHVALRNVPRGYVTANARRSPDDPSIFVFNDCTVGSAPGATIKPGAYYLGRPKGEYAQVVFQKTNLSDAINPKGWDIWDQGDTRTQHVLFGECRNRGPGAEGTRATFSRRLDEPVSIASILGDGHGQAGYYDPLFVP